ERLEQVFLSQLNRVVTAERIDRFEALFRLVAAQFLCVDLDLARPVEVVRERRAPEQEDGPTQPFHAPQYVMEGALAPGSAGPARTTALWSTAWRAGRAPTEPSHEGALGCRARAVGDIPRSRGRGRRGTTTTLRARSSVADRSERGPGR